MEPNNERNMELVGEEEEEVVFLYEVWTVESSEEEGSMAGEEMEEEDGFFTEEEEDDSMEEGEDDYSVEEEDVNSGEEEEEDNDESEENGDYLMEEEEGEGLEEEEYGIGEELEEEEDYVMEENGIVEADAEVRPEGVGMDALYPREVEELVWAEGVSMEERIVALRQRLRQAEDSVRQWEEFHRQSLHSGAYIGCSRAATISAHGGWPVVQAFLDGDGVRLIAAILAVAIVLAAYIVAALSRVIMTALVLRGLV